MTFQFPCCCNFRVFSLLSHQCPQIIFIGDDFFLFSRDAFLLGSTSYTIDSIELIMHIDRRHASYPRERLVGGDEPVMRSRAWDRYAGKVRSSSRMRSRGATA